MNRALVAAAALLVTAGCRKSASAEHNAACQKACERYAQRKTEPAIHMMKLVVHEKDEAVDSAEEFVKKQSEVLDKAEKEFKPWDEKNARGLPPGQRKAVIDHHRWEEQQLLQQRADERKKLQQIVPAAKAEYAAEQKKFEDDSKKLIDDATAECVPSCLKRSAAAVECMQHLQAVEDMEICERK